MDPTFPLSGVAVWIADRYRAKLETRRKVSVLVRDGYFMHGVGASPLTTPPEMMTSVPTTGTGGHGEKVVPYYFMKVTNLSPNREIEVTHAWFTGAPGSDRRRAARSASSLSWAV